MTQWPDLRLLLHGLRWAVVGAVATRAYMPERHTADLDILVDPAEAPLVWERLHAAGWTPVSDLAIGGRVWAMPDGLEVDVLEGHQPWVQEALSGAEPDSSGQPIIGLPYLVIMKMTASRSIDLGDLSRMLGLASDPQLAAVRRAVSRYLPEDREDLETLIFLGRQEMGGAPGAG